MLCAMCKAVSYLLFEKTPQPFNVHLHFLLGSFPGHIETCHHDFLSLCNEPGNSLQSLAWLKRVHQSNLSLTTDKLLRDLCPNSNLLSMGIPEALESPNLLAVVSVEKSLHQILPPVSSWPFQLPGPEPTPAKTLQSSLYLNLQLLLYEILQNGTIDFVCVCVEGGPKLRKYCILL